MRIEGQGATESSYVASQAPKADGMKLPGDEQKAGVSADPQLGQKLERAVELVNETFKVSNHNLKFELHEASGRYQVKVLDSDTGDVVREIPAERVLEFSAQIKQMLNDAIGILFDERA